MDEKSTKSPKAPRHRYLRDEERVKELGASIVSYAEHGLLATAAEQMYSWIDELWDITNRYRREQTSLELESGSSIIKDSPHYPPLPSGDL